MDRFDDVRVHFFEDEDEPPRRSTGRRRWALAAAAIVALAGGSGAQVAAGEEAAKRQRPAATLNSDGVPHVRDGHECEAGKGSKLRHRGTSGAAPSVKY